MPEIHGALATQAFPAVLTDAKGFLVAVLKAAHEPIRVACCNCALAESHQQICLGGAATAIEAVCGNPVAVGADGGRRLECHEIRQRTG